MKKGLFPLFLLAALTLRAELEVVPGYVSASLHLAGIEVKDESEFQSKLFCGKKGGPLRPVLPLICNAAEKAARGVVVGLEENTEYELRLEYAYNGKKGEVRKTFRTENSCVPVAETVTLTRENWRRIADDLKSGTPKGYIRYTAAPGTVLDATGREFGIHVKGKYMLFDNLVIRNAEKDGIRLEGADHIVIRNCDIAQYGRKGTWNKKKLGRFYEGKLLLNSDSGIWILSSSRILVEKCYIHDTRGHANSWFYSHPAGPKALAAKAASAVTLRYNDFIGSDRHRYNDVIECFENSSPTGGFYRDAEIYGNYLAIANDDGIELEGGGINSRFFRNRIEGTLCGISTGCCVSGPIFVFENLVCDPGDEFNHNSTAFKNGHSKFGTGTLRHFNNTGVGFQHGINAFSVNANRDYLKLAGLNNVLDVVDSYCSPNGMFVKAQSTLDYTLCTGALAPGYRKVALSRGQDTHGIIADPKFADPATGNYRLRPDSPGTGTGKPIPGFTPEDKVNRGAFPRPDSPDLPERPFSLHSSKAFIRLDCEKVPAATLTLTAAEKTDFVVRKNDDFTFFTVTPEAGTVEPGKPLVLTVEVDRKNLTQARLNRGAFLIRRSDGLSRPVGVEVDSRSLTHLTAELRKKAVYGTPVPGEKDTWEFDVPEKDVWYLFAYAEKFPKKVTFRVPGNRDFAAGPVGFSTIEGPHWRQIAQAKRFMLLPKGKVKIRIGGIRARKFAIAPFAEVFALDPRFEAPK
ncbi:MAG: right-handed parallel beta-helix repeat-containing protein [Lentisphaeria bacterium]|nr:right-handed parallel beta-helix repeat-containing protein [Lentisphaeria bacterium]